MSNTAQLIIPTRIKVGFQKRTDTYTGQLAYVIYFDSKGKLRKETSWNSWRDDKIDPVEHDNKPTAGFVLNKGVGGQRASSGWNARNEYIRVYDPRDFEFEISVANLLFILREGDCSRGKGLEGKFVYAWGGTELVLLPVASADYKTCAEFTGLQDKRVKAKELIAGATYITKRQKQLVFIGKLDCWAESGYYGSGSRTASTKLVFWTGTDWEFADSPKALAQCVSDAPVPNYAELRDAYHCSKYGTKVVSLAIRPQGPRMPEDSRWYHWTVDIGDGLFKEYQAEFCGYGTNAGKLESVRLQYDITLSPEGVLRGAADPHRHGYDNWRDPFSGRSNNKIGQVEIQQTALWATLESGSEFKVSGGRLVEPPKKENGHGE